MNLGAPALAWQVYCFLAASPTGRPGFGARRSDGWAVGVGPSLVVIDEGMARTTTTAKDDIYAYIFGQKGLIAGLGIQGSKITRMQPKP